MEIGEGKEGYINTDFYSTMGPITSLKPQWENSYKKNRI